MKIKAPEVVDNLFKIRHSAAHVLAEAVTALCPFAHPTIGPVTKDGFFYDFFIKDQSISNEDLPLIEAKMREIIKNNEAIVGRQVSKAEAYELYKENKFKREIIDALDQETVGIYWQGEFYDLCRGGHTEKTGDVKHFKLTTVAGANWRADVTREPLQRIYGVAFEKEAELSDYVKRMEEAKLYDHRLIGKSLDLFSFHQEAPGSVFFHEKGAFIFNKLVEFARKNQDLFDYKEIKTPLVLKESLWKTSGHYDNFRENMFFLNKNQDEVEGFAIRPMNCPCAMLVYQNSLRSYRDLPLRFSEFGMCHRNEVAGALHGMMRTRVFTQDDAHIFCTPDQLESEIISVLNLAKIVYDKFDFKNVKMSISTRPEKSLGTDEQWDNAINALGNGLTKLGYEFEINEGEGAFYGPKIEIRITDAIGREWQCGTVQVDFVLPERFGLKYVDSDQARKTPIVVHRAIMGSLERFFAILLEHTKGRMPLWLAPIQAKVLPVTDAQNDYSLELVKKLKMAGVRVACDLSSDKIGAKIRGCQLEQVNLMIVIGKREQEAGLLTVRRLDGTQVENISADQLIVDFFKSE